MPIKIPADLPATETLHKENIFVMTHTRASTQDIRPLRIVLLNLMPKKIETETQLSRLLGNTPLQIELTLLRLAVFEMLYRADVPPKVAINEALELSTRFGDAKAKSFINGILDAAIKAQEAGTLTVAGKADA